MKVLFLPELRDYFREPAQVLYEKDYFGFEETAIQYAEGNTSTLNGLSAAQFIPVLQK
jgi:hypothetical protein